MLFISDLEILEHIQENQVNGGFFTVGVVTTGAITSANTVPGLVTVNGSTTSVFSIFGNVLNPSFTTSTVSFVNSIPFP